MRHRLFAVVAMLALAVPAASITPARAEETNTAVGVNTKDGSSIFKVAFQIKKVMDGDVDSANAAVAYSNCTECQTVAVAIQIVLVVGESDSATPTNIAVAINENCQSCETMAAAYQFVYGVGDDFRFSKEGKKRLHELRKRVHDLRKRSDLSLEQIAAELESITTEISEVLEDELVPAAEASDSTSTSTSTSTTAPDSTTTTTDDDEVTSTTSAS